MGADDRRSRARARADRLAALDAQLKEVVETRELPKLGRQPLPAPGELPEAVRVLVDDGQLRRGTTLLENLTGCRHDEAVAAVAAYRDARG